jgi:hypothetical protein
MEESTAGTNEEANIGVGRRGFLVPLVGQVVPWYRWCFLARGVPMRYYHYIRCGKPDGIGPGIV